MMAQQSQEHNHGKISQPNKHLRTSLEYFTVCVKCKQAEIKVIISHIKMGVTTYPLPDLT